MTLTVICPTLNEEKYIAQTILSFIAQKNENFNLEILIVDGMSTDRTRQIVSAFSIKYPFVRLIDNEERRTPFAFNKGLREAKGEFVAILGAHAKYDDDYLKICLQELQRTNAAGCTGRIISKSPKETFGALSVEWVMNSPFGVSSSSFRTIKEGYVHSVNFAVFYKDILLRLGGYDTSLFRNQDNDMNQRILDSGHKLYCTWKTKCYYYTPPSISALYKYGYRNGYWNAISLISKTRSMRFYHFIPFIFLMSLITLLLGMFAEKIFFTTHLVGLTMIIVLLFYFGVALLFTINSIFKSGDIRKIVLPFLFFGFHLSYGYGTKRGLLELAFKPSRK